MTLHERLEEVFHNVFSDDSITLTADTTSADIPAWDSVAHINLMFSIEQEFGIQFPGNTFAEFKTIGELEKYLADKGK
jgi:acyl carrier protein